ncbi:thioredoxin domain-containing protein 16 isoform X2 [Epinephelus moara]|nr:thioredoxin domain-containing protein 16 isoform X2 [Epinephelus moara]XP_049918949.1 thioredoxin domain-containing protein 16 isoform X2 [Epinephelus moara]XP_049918950.1 thioredoxin domain-containing protein 16 isoform X2 [Epinephelus moara]XP_049918951.1 thioredoxin domain-containing protein 16 isoform X2 [Epinephelus moara]XP_049918952.1 thioredoxin domain-containing protein 16 isoform X2 [Epinephelus moara]XP_049918953.1 thioredoxin domain-containing protein 16 isoform X2 [Epinephelus 
MWMCIAVFLLWMRSGGCTEKANTSDLIEYTAADFYEKLHSGKMMFIYFEHQVSPTISLFLVELEKSADALQDYGVLVGKVNCNKELVHTYCTEERALHTAFLFRGGKEFLGFDLDTVFDVNSIVSEVLFAILREEVKYVHTDTDLLAMEKAVRGKKDIVLGYVRSLGTQEHRSMMETAYVYGSKYQFILITGGPVLKHLGVNELSHSSRVWFLHCTTPKSSERCPLTRMRKPLSTLSLHSFLQLMEAPLVTEVYEDPSSVQPPQFPYQQTPQVFLFSRPATKHLDLDTATTLAWRLRGLALLVLVHRQSPAVKTPSEYNAAYRLPEKSSEVKYLTLQVLDEVLELFKNQDKEEEDEDEGVEEDDEDTHFGKLDDEVAMSFYESRGNLLDMDLIIQLTSDNFHATVAQSSLTVVLFYLRWDAVSMSCLSSFIEVAEILEVSSDSDVQMCAVDCGEWTDLCAAQPGGSLPIPFQPITTFPSILLLRPQQTAQHYRGMLGSEALYRFIVLSQPESPALLSTQEEVTSFLQVPHAELAGYKPGRVLGLFRTQTHTGVPLFTEAANSLRGEVLSGLLTDGLAEKWAAEHTVDLPALLVFPSWKTHTHPSILSLSTSAEELLSHINTALLHPLPELTVENLPSFLSLGKALLLLFVGEEEDEIGQRQNQALVEEMRGVVALGGGKMERYLACWIHLGRTPAGMSVLGSYLGSMPPLPALVLTHLPSGDEIYQYPPNTPIVASSVLQWLQRIEGGTESAAGMLGEDSWPPNADFYDFLKAMDMQESNSTQQHPPEGEVEEEEEDEEDVNIEEHVMLKEATDSSSSVPTSDSNPDTHSEL